jgi:hypothetical protein
MLWKVTVNIPNLVPFEFGMLTWARRSNSIFWSPAFSDPTSRPRFKNSLLQDILHPLDHVEQLFPILTGATWQQAVTAASKSAKSDFRPTVVFYNKASKGRNQLLHLGNKMAVSPNLAKQCLTHMTPLIKLFVELHNIYIVKPL